MSRVTEDTALLQPPLELGDEGIERMLQFWNNATQEIRNLMANECTVSYHCRFCNNIFRSLLNFVSHKRGFCRTLCGIQSESTAKLYMQLAEKASAQLNALNEENQAPVRKKGILKRTNMVGVLKKRVEHFEIPLPNSRGVLDVMTLPRISKPIPTTTFENGEQVFETMPRFLAQKEREREIPTTLVIPEDNTARYGEMTLRRRENSQKGNVMRQISAKEMEVFARLEKLVPGIIDFGTFSCLKKECENKKPFSSIFVLAYHVTVKHNYRSVVNNAVHCVICGDCFKRYAELVGHLGKKHKGLREEHRIARSLVVVEKDRKRGRKPKAANKASSNERSRSLSPLPEDFVADEVVLEAETGAAKRKGRKPSNAYAIADSQNVGKKDHSDLSVYGGAEEDPKSSNDIGTIAEFRDDFVECEKKMEDEQSKRSKGLEGVIRVLQVVACRKAYDSLEAQQFEQAVLDCVENLVEEVCAKDAVQACTEVVNNTQLYQSDAGEEIAVERAGAIPLYTEECEKVAESLFKTRSYNPDESGSQVNAECLESDAVMEFLENEAQIETLATASDPKMLVQKACISDLSEEGFEVKTEVGTASDSSAEILTSIEQLGFVSCYPEPVKQTDINENLESLQSDEHIDDQLPEASMNFTSRQPVPLCEGSADEDPVQDCKSDTGKACEIKQEVMDTSMTEDVYEYERTTALTAKISRKRRGRKPAAQKQSPVKDSGIVSAANSRPARQRRKPNWIQENSYMTTTLRRKRQCRNAHSDSRTEDSNDSVNREEDETRTSGGLWDHSPQQHFYIMPSTARENDRLNVQKKLILESRLHYTPRARRYKFGDAETDFDNSEASTSSNANTSDSRTGLSGSETTGSLVRPDPGKIPVYLTEAQRQLFFSFIVHVSSAASSRFKCLHCSELFPTMTEGRKHAVGHLRIMRLRCSLCGCGSFFHSDMRNHIMQRYCEMLEQAPPDYVKAGNETPCMTPEQADDLIEVVDSAKPGRIMFTSGKIISAVSLTPYFPDPKTEEKILGTQPTDVDAIGHADNVTHVKFEV